jgi:predicted transcriptional regulator
MNNDERGAPRLVRDLMTVGVPTCALATPLSEVARALLEKDLEALVLLDDNGHAVGIVSRTEVAAAYGSGEFKDLVASDVMRDGMPQVPPDIPLTAAVQIMLDMGVRVLYQTHHAGGIEYPAAYLSFNHVMRHVAAEDLEELRDLGRHAQRESPMESFIKRRDEARRRQSGL